jgi:hypothetical protein
MLMPIGFISASLGQRNIQLCACKPLLFFMRSGGNGVTKDIVQ